MYSNTNGLSKTPNLGSGKNRKPNIAQLTQIWDVVCIVCILRESTEMTSEVGEQQNSGKYPARRH